MSSQSSSPLLRLPRELRDAILETVVQTEEPQQHKLKATPQPFDGAHIISTSSIILTCRQLHHEYTDVLQTIALAAPYTERDLHATVYNVQFHAVINFINRLPPSSHAAFHTGSKLKIDLYFSSAAGTKRSDLLKWLTCANSVGIKAEYRASRYLESHPPFTPVTFVNIYDLFGEEGSDPTAEEERMFQCLQSWYAFRACNGPIRCGNGARRIRQRERERAQELGLRTAKTAEECERPVRVETCGNQS